ncbi:hypothetical protein QTP88_001043 [Uroleucon formosanum]
MDLEFFNSSSSSSSSESDYEILFSTTNFFFRYNDLEFLEHFRVRRHIANNLTIHFEASPEFNDTIGRHGKIPAYNQILIFLWFAGHQTASFRNVADWFGITISSLFRVVRRLTHFISRMASTIITWPNEEEKQSYFFQIKGFPNVIGAIDGSHIRIDKPSSDPDSYYNRKKYFSIHMQAVCDHRNKIRNIYIGFPGSVHDARVFRRSPLATNLGILCQENVILGDKAYSCLRNLITPFEDNGRLSRQQINFNKTLSSCRYVIEHCFGLLKQKFRQLYHCKLRKIEHIVHFIRAYCVLHNLAIDDKFQIIIENEDEINNGDDLQLDDDNVEGDIPEGTTYKNYLMQRMFP